MNHPLTSFIQLPESSLNIDSYTALRGAFSVLNQDRYRLQVIGASWFQVWIDGEWFLEGPARFIENHPEYEEIELPLTPGKHLITILLNHLGVETRLLKKGDPFLSALLFTQSNVELPISWKALPFDGFRPAVRRINPQLGWCEWCDTRLHPLDWQKIHFDDSSWIHLKQLPEKKALQRLQLAPVQQWLHEIQPIAEGEWVERYGYESDDPPVRFLLRDLAPKSLPPQGIWRRYDLGRVRLGKTSLVLNLPAGTVVELGYSENLHEGRVAPMINLSCGASCNFDHYIARGGIQIFGPISPRGGRYLEIHVLGKKSEIEWISTHFIERCYHGASEGSFECEDPLLNQIWKVGVETYRACAEDAIVDNPTRERGQWTGDVVSVGLDIASVAYRDLRLLRRGLIQSAQSAKESGLVAGLCPGGDVFLGSYAAQWVTACLQYHQITGDQALLIECFPSAVRNLEAFTPFLTEAGLQEGIDWPFIDWGYLKKENEIDLAMNLHLLQAYRSFLIWCDLLNIKNERVVIEQRAQSLTETLQRFILQKITKGFSPLGYHGTVLALALQLVPTTNRKEAVQFIQHHLENSFPNNPHAPRLSDPSANHEQLITPYFAHYAFQVLIQEGEMAFVLNQYRKCWGWMLKQQSGTWIEVFDPRWSHCHQWAGCPTWQLSRYGLGLRPRLDRGPAAYEFSLSPGDLNQARGTLPLATTDQLLHIQWSRIGSEIHYEITTPIPIEIWNVPGEKTAISVKKSWKTIIKT